MEDAEEYGNQQVLQSKKDGTDYELLFSKIEELSNRYASTLNGKIEDRKEEMLEDDNYII